MNDADLLRRAATLMRERAKAARRDHDERWMVDQSPDDGLIIGSYVPEDVDQDGVVSTSCIAYFAYPDDEGRRAYGNAMAVATHMASWAPFAALAVADWLDSHVGDLASARGVIDACDSPGDVRHALTVARAYLDGGVS